MLKMLFEEISQLAATAEPQPDGMSITEILCYQSLSLLFERFMLGSLDQEQVEMEKQRIETAFSTRQGFDEMYRDMFHVYQDNTFKSSALRVAINKAKDKTAAELFSMAVECISAMTGDTVFLKNIGKVQPVVRGGDKGAQRNR